MEKQFKLKEQILKIYFSIFLTYIAACCVSIEFEDHKEGMNTNMNPAAVREQRGPSGQSRASLTPSRASVSHLKSWD